MDNNLDDVIQLEHPHVDANVAVRQLPDRDLDEDILRWISSGCRRMYDSELNQTDLFHGEASELISSGNEYSGNASIDRELSRYPTCNIVAIPREDGKIPDSTRSYDSIKDSPINGIVLFEILLWLPVASLLRLKSVCKYWCALIESSTFITQHFYHNSNEDNIVARYNWISYEDYNFCMFSGSKYEEFVNLEFEPNWYPVKEIDIVDSCNGIICLKHQKTGDVALWNPAMKQLKRLPESLMGHQCNEILGERLNIDEVGFGFDVKSNDYKVVRIRHEEDGFGVEVYNIEVYNLKTNSWRTIDIGGVFPFKYICTPHATSKDGICFWTTIVDPLFGILVSFDLRDEKFETMPLPGDFSQPYVLEFVNDKLAYVRGDSCRYCPLDTYFEIWVLLEHGVKESWRKMYTIGPIGNGYLFGFYPAGFSRNGEFLLLSYGMHSLDDHGRLYLLNLRTRENKVLRLQKPNPYIHQFIHYNESLVSVTQ